MIKYLPLLFLIACNSEMQKETASAINPNAGIQDSLNVALDSLKTDLTSLIAVSDYAKEAQARIKQLEKEKNEVEVERSKEISYTVSHDYTQYKSDDRDKKIAELTRKVYQYENEIASLKRKLKDDSVKISKVDKVPNEPVNYEPEKPNDHSLVITLDRKLRGDGDISEQGVSVWIMKYNKKAKKIFKGYDNCQQKDLNLLDAKEASYFQGQYFFNDIEPVEYLIKVCALYGNWMVINKKDYKQEIRMLMSPPIQ
jgi:chromosome segregation ATPase